MDSFSNQVKTAMNNITNGINSSIVKSTEAAFNKSVQVTPAPPTPSGQEYQRTGRLRFGWNVSKNLGSSTSPSKGLYGMPTMKPLTFNIDKDIYVKIYNNVPYAYFVDQGKGQGQTPTKMLWQGYIAFKDKFYKEINKL